MGEGAAGEGAGEGEAGDDEASVIEAGPLSRKFRSVPAVVNGKAYPKARSRIHDRHEVYLASLSLNHLSVSILG